MRLAKQLIKKIEDDLRPATVDISVDAQGIVIRGFFMGRGIRRTISTDTIYELKEEALAEHILEVAFDIKKDLLGAICNCEASTRS